MFYALPPLPLPLLLPPPPLLLLMRRRPWPRPLRVATTGAPGPVRAPGLRGTAGEAVAGRRAVGNRKRIGQDGEMR